MNECKGKLGEGSYGCVYTPPIPCVGKSIKRGDKRLVGKIFSKPELANDEEKIMEIVAKIDPKGKFTTPLRDTCSVIPTEKLKSECAHARSARMVMKQLVYDYKGIDLCNFMKSEDYDILDHLEGLKNVANALKALASAGYSHRDMKPPNIMMYEESMYLTDFGLLLPFERIYEEEQDYVLSFNYEYYPPEFKIYYDLKMATSPITDISDIKAFIVNDVRANYSESENIIRFKTVEDTVSSLIDSFKTSKLLEAGLRMHASKIDVFGFGMTFMKMFIKSKKTTKSKLVRKKLYYILEKCMDPNPLTRIESSELVMELSLLTKLVKER